MRDNRRAVRQAIVNEHKRWGLLPPQTHGKGLVLFLLMMAPLVAVTIVALVSEWPSWTNFVLIPSGVAGIAGARHTNAWLNEQADLVIAGD